MKKVNRNQSLDLLGEERRGGEIQLPGVAEFLANAPDPAVREVGDSELSAREDVEILQELGALRRTANQHDS